MNTVLEKVFPSFNRHQQNQQNYYSYPEGSKDASVVFQIHYHHAEPATNARVLLFFAPNADEEPRHEALEIENLRPMFAKDVSSLQPGDIIQFDSAEYSIPDSLGFVPLDLSTFSTKLYVQALINRDVLDPDSNTCVGNVYSKPIQVQLEISGGQCVIDLHADQLVKDERDLQPTEWIEYVSFKSQLLSDFRQKDVFFYAGVVLPPHYRLQKDTHKYPTLYYIEGFTGTESYAERAKAFIDSELGDDWKQNKSGVPMLRVTLGSRFTYGHTSFADSDVNGPWATALITEFIPYVESQFAALPTSQGRFLHGHSSGGWSALWLQLQYPEFFGGSWSSGPDPVDFNRFQIVNLYESDNLYWDAHGRPFPTMRCHGEVVCSIRDENQLERVYSPTNGGQWDAFCAVFGPRGRDGKPVPLFNKICGAINRSVLQHWERYDICRWLQNEPAILANPHLKGKLHVICGVEDNYYLDGACKTLQKLVGVHHTPGGSYVKLVSGDHTNIRSRAHYEQIHAEMAMAFRQSGH